MGSRIDSACYAGDYGRARGIEICYAVMAIGQGDEGDWVDILAAIQTKACEPLAVAEKIDIKQN